MHSMSPRLSEKLSKIIKSYSKIKNNKKEPGKLLVPSKSKSQR